MCGEWFCCRSGSADYEHRTASSCDPFQYTGTALAKDAAEALQLAQKPFNAVLEFHDQLLIMATSNSIALDKAQLKRLRAVKSRGDGGGEGGEIVPAKKARRKH